MDRDTLFRRFHQSEIYTGSAHYLVSFVLISGFVPTDFYMTLHMCTLSDLCTGNGGGYKWISIRIIRIRSLRSHFMLRRLTHSHISIRSIFINIKDGRLGVVWLECSLHGLSGDIIYAIGLSHVRRTIFPFDQSSSILWGAT
jgi:hypothetical protein